jgi:hypothetical protein
MSVREIHGVNHEVLENPQSSSLVPAQITALLVPFPADSLFIASLSG